jgi:hypothetical protein
MSSSLAVVGARPALHLLHAHMFPCLQHLILHHVSHSRAPRRPPVRPNPWAVTPTTGGVVRPFLLIFLPAESIGAVTSSVVHAKLLNNDGGEDLPELLLVELCEECVQSHLSVFLLPVFASRCGRKETGRGGTSRQRRIAINKGIDVFYLPS